MIRDVNPFLIELLDYSKEQFLEKEIWEIGFLKDIVANHDKFIELQQNEYVRYENLPLETANGRKINVEFVSNVYIVDKKKVIQCNIRDITKRKKLEQTLIESEEKFRSYIENATDGVFIIDNTGRYVETNKAACSILGYSVDEILKLSISDLCADESLEDGLAHFKQLTETGMASSDLLHKHKDGSKRWLTINAVKLSESLFLGFAKDITERKHFQELESTNNQRLELAMRSANMAWWEMDITTGNVNFDKRKAEMLGYHPDDFKHYKDFMALVHPDDNEKAMDAMRKHLEGKVDKYEVEYRIKTNAGNYKWFYDIGSVVKHDDKRLPSYIVGLVIDINDRKQAEVNLIASEVRYRRLFESAKDGVIILDAETGMIMDVNPFLIELLDYSKEQFLKKEIWEIGFFKDIVANHDKFIELQLKEYVRYENLPLETANGRKINVEFVSNVYIVDKKKVIQCNIRDITKRKKLEQALMKSEEKYRFLIENMKEGIFVTDEKGKITFANKALANIHGFDNPDKLLNRYFSDFMDSSIKSEMKQNYSNEMLSGEISPLQILPVIKADGSTGYVQVQPSLIYKEKIIIGTMGIVQDITKRKLAEHRQNFLTEILSILNAPTSFMHTINIIIEAIKRETGFDAVGIRLRQGDDFPYFVQKGFLNEFLLTENNLTVSDDIGICRDENGNPILECTCGLVISGKTNPANPLFTSGGSAWTNNSQILLDIPADNDPRIHPRNRCIHDGYLSVALIPIRTNNEIVGLLQLNDRKKDCFTLDMIHFYEHLSESIGVALMRKQAEIQIRDLAKFPEENLNPVFRISKDGVLLYSNPSSRNLLPDFFPLTNKKISEEWIKKIKNIYDSGKNQFEEIEFNEKIFSFNFVPVIEGEYINIYCIDISDRKYAERIVIEHQRLKAIGEMASSIAHDFNNSLQAIFGNVELALHNPDLSETTLQFLTSIKTAAGDAASRVQQIQRFGGIIPSKHRYSPVDINLLISEVIIQIRPLWKDKAEEKGISITINSEPGRIPRISGNNGDLRSVLFNIFKNGIEAMPEGGSISIKTERNKEGVIARIKDTGTGMNEETRNRIFQPFFSTKGFDIGRGLGMSGVYSIINEHGGRISVLKTAPGKGTTIEIIFPFLQKSGLEEKQTEEKTFAVKNCLRVLWVEDDSAIRINAGMMLEMLGHNVDTASNGQEALEFLQVNTYDIIFTDLGMPVMNGWQLADKIKEQFGGKMKVVVVSGWGNEIDEDKKNKHGVEYVLGKPFKIEEIEKILGGVAQLGSKQSM